MTQVSLTIAIADDHLDNILDVAQDLRSAGMQVAQIMDTVGVITGYIEQSRMNSVSAIAGVESVESSRSYKLSPPNATAH